VLGGLLLVIGSLGSVLAIDQPADPGGAPEPKSGPFQPSGFVRVVDGDSLEVVIDERRVAVGIVGIDAPQLSSECGKAARAETQALVGRGVVLQDDPAMVLDERKRRMYHASTLDGRSVAAALVSAGLARANGVGAEAATLSALESQARQSQAGCVWGGPVPAPRAKSQQQTSIQSTAPGTESASAQAVGARTAADSVSVQAAGSVLPNFADDTVVSGLSFPTAFAFLPDGRALVAEKDGRVRLVTGGSLQPDPVLDIDARVNSYWDRGILGIAIDPGFTSNRFFYVFAVFESNAANDTGPKSSQVLRYTLRPDNTADPNGGTVILGTVTGNGCPDPATLADCLPAEGSSHSGGSLRFGSDGYLYVSTGDAASFTAVDPLALRAQDPNSLAGKILRVTPTGQGVSSNPFWDGDPNHSRSKVWARGFRNPFRIALRPGNPPMPYVGDVGWSTWEEVDIVPAGINAGWPCYEGNHVQSGYATYPVCASLYTEGLSAVRAPVTEWPHNGGGGAALAGTFYTASAFPPTYQGAFFYADYAIGWVRSVSVDSNHQFVSVPAQFAGGQSGLVQMEVGPDGALWYVAIGSGELRRISYVGNYTPIQCPNGQFRAEYYKDTQSLSGAPAAQRCEATIDYDWGFGAPIDGVGVDNFSVRWTGRFPFGNDTYTFSATSDDGARIFVDGEQILNDWASGAANTVAVSKAMTAGDHTVTVEYFDDCCPAVMRASWQGQTANTAPVPTITAPASGATFKVGDVIQLQGSATDAQDGAISGASLRWDVIQKHCPGFGTDCHDHPLLTLSGPTTQFTAPDHGDGSYFEIRLTATDSRGVTTTTTRRVDPKTIQVTLATNPSGGTVVYDGTSRTAPYTATTIAGSTHSIEVQTGAGQTFASWSQGGAQRQNVTVGEQNVTYTASFGTPGPPTPPPAPLICSPRPQVWVTSVPGSGQRLVTVGTTSNPGSAANTLKSIHFDETRRAVLAVPQYPVGPAPFTSTYVPGTNHTTFAINRTAPGALLVRFTVTDDCGSWPTFIGAGPTAGW
jgi:glucose/arabinose dehydrogenase